MIHEDAEVEGRGDGRHMIPPSDRNSLSGTNRLMFKDPMVHGTWSGTRVRVYEPANCRYFLLLFAFRLSYSFRQRRRAQIWRACPGHECHGVQQNKSRLTEVKAIAILWYLFLARFVSD